MGYDVQTNIIYKEVAQNCDALGSGARGLTFYQSLKKLEDFAGYLILHRKGQTFR